MSGETWVFVAFWAAVAVVLTELFTAASCVNAHNRDTAIACIESGAEWVDGDCVRK